MPIPQEIGSLKQALNQLAEKIDLLADQVCGVEATIGKTISFSDGQEISAVTNLQSLDYVRQSLEDLTMLVYGLSSISADIKLDQQEVLTLQQKLKMQDTREILSHPTTKELSVSQPLTGEVDLF